MSTPNGLSSPQLYQRPHCRDSSQLATAKEGEHDEGHLGMTASLVDEEGLCCGIRPPSSLRRGPIVVGLGPRQRR